MGPARSLSSNTESLTTWAIVEEWVRECNEQHHCLDEVNTNWYPTRLVERLSDDTFRVIRSDSGLFKPGRGYITLSHRWGNDDFVKLTAESLAAFENGQPIKTLRKTFRDTLIITQRLNIPYVWIDSLCIIQSGDNGADWRQESTTMAKVYSNSLCNISADWGDESNGLFFERTPRFQPPFPLKMQWKARQNNEDGYHHPTLSRPRPDEAPIYIIFRDGWSENTAESPLNHRGWVLQERLLAPRVLHFSPNQISWECGHKMLWERIPLNLMDSRPMNREFDPSGADGYVPSYHMEHLKLHGLRSVRDWSTTVADYSACQLTKRSDRLVAIAGIARKLCPIVKDQYVAGLWAGSLPEALLWNLSHEEKGARCPQTQYFAPSFSWAAAGGRVRLPAVHIQPVVPEVSAAFIKHRKKGSPPLSKDMRAGPIDEILKDDVFGPLSSPHVELRLCGKLRSCCRVPPHLHSRLGPWETYACPSTAASVDRSAMRRCFDNYPIFRVVYDRLDEKDEGMESTLFYYTIIERRVTTGKGSRSRFGSYHRVECHVEGLFLKLVDASMGRFERVGFMMDHGTKDGPDFREPLGNERDLPAWSYDETTGEHTFYIV